SLFDQATFCDVSADGIGTVSNDEDFTRFLCSLGSQRHRPHVGVHPCADILNVVDENIDVIEHSSSRRRGLTIQRVNLYSSFLIHARSDCRTSTRRASQSVFGRKQGSESYTRCVMQKIDRACPLLVAARMICY